MLLAAIAWPLDLLQYVPGLGVSLLVVVAAMMLPALLFDAMAQQKLRVPFEILAPTVLVVLLTGIAAVRQSSLDAYVEILAAAGLAHRFRGRFHVQTVMILRRSARTGVCAGSSGSSTATSGFR